MTHAAESLHWYDRKGLPAYTVKAKAGHDRPTTLADARKLCLVPSVTNIIKCAAAPALERWKQQQVLMAALTLTRISGETEEAYLDRIMQDSKEQARTAANRGTSIHAAIQGAFQNEGTDGLMIPYVEGVRRALGAWAGSEYDEECLMPEQSFAHPLGFGGKTDLSCTSPYFVVDFKTKEFDTTADLKTWDEHAMQLAAYSRGLEMPENTRCAIGYVSVTVPGLVKLIELTPEDLAKGWTMFYSLLHYWKAKNCLDTAFQLEAAAA